MASQKTDLIFIEILWHESNADIYVEWLIVYGGMDQKSVIYSYWLNLKINECWVKNFNETKW